MIPKAAIIRATSVTMRSMITETRSESAIDSEDAPQRLADCGGWIEEYTKLGVLLLAFAHREGRG